MEPAQVKAYEPIVSSFNEQFDEVNASLNKYKNILGFPRPLGGVIMSTGIYQKTEGRLEMITTIKLRAMTDLLEIIKALITQKSLATAVISLFVNNPEDTLLAGLQQKIEKVKKIHDDLVEKLKDDLVYYPGDIVFDEKSFYPARMKAFPDISECHCCEPMTRNKGILRSNFSEILVSKLESLKPLNDTDQEITLCSVGSGGCFHELEIHAKLIVTLTNHSKSDEVKSLVNLKKYKVKWVLIDPKYKDKKEAPEMFEFLAKTIHAPVEVETHLRMEDYFKLPSATPDVIMAIDFEDGCNSIDTQPLRDKQKELIAKGHKCVLAILDKWKHIEDKEIEILEPIPVQSTP